MLELAIKARLPIVRAHTTDLSNLPMVLGHLAGKNVVLFNGRVDNLRVDPAPLYYIDTPLECNRKLYDALVAVRKTLILINQDDSSGLSFDSGEVPVPRELLLNLLEEVLPGNQVKDFLPLFSGLTLKTVAEVISLTRARDKKLTEQGIRQTRTHLAGTLQGLQQVDTSLPLYLCPEGLKQWIGINRSYFLHAPDPRLVPRGLLFAGIPGIGKTQAAKYIANEFEVPLYRLDLSSSLSKWVGESEQGLARSLGTIDQEEPCLLLIDEVEKLFSGTEDAGVTARLLSQLLWWLQEHRSRVLTVLTTNDLEALPRELYRQGRVDQVFNLEPLHKDQAQILAAAVLLQFIQPSKAQGSLLVQKITSLFCEDVVVPHAAIVQAVYDTIKQKAWLT